MDILEQIETDPFEQFNKWYQEAVAAEIHRPDAMTLATAAADGKPSARIVLYKGIRSNGFVFFTNYESQKGQELSENPQAALVFYWSHLYRQVRLEGRVERTTEVESEEYWQSRPRESCLSAAASAQSRPISGRAELEEAVKRLRQQYEGSPVPRPECWGGFRLIPDRFEFWQGQPNRLHDRFCYRLNNKTWELYQLAP